MNTFKTIIDPSRGSIAKAMYVAHNIDSGILAFKEFEKQIKKNTQVMKKSRYFVLFLVSPQIKYLDNHLLS